MSTKEKGGTEKSHLENFGTGKKQNVHSRKYIQEPKRITSYIQTQRKFMHSYFNQ